MTANQPIMARFIGGPWNGKTEYLAERMDEVKVPALIKPELMHARQDEPISFGTGMSVHVYRRHGRLLEFPNVHVYRYDGVTSYPETALPRIPLEPRPKTLYAVRSYNPPALWRCDTLTEAQTASERFPGLQIREIYRREGEGNWELISPETEERETHNG